MDLINVLKKLGTQFLNPREKEVRKMKKIVIVTTLALFTVVFGLTPANAALQTYTPVGSASTSESKKYCMICVGPLSSPDAW